jgi:XRE family transcriptional regulator of biofilm formation
VLKKLREVEGLTQEELARRAKVTRPYLTMLETGAKRNPSLAILKRLAPRPSACR